MSQLHLMRHEEPIAELPGPIEETLPAGVVDMSLEAARASVEEELRLYGEVLR